MFTPLSEIISPAAQPTPHGAVMWGQCWDQKQTHFGEQTSTPSSFEDCSAGSKDVHCICSCCRISMDPAERRSPDAEPRPQLPWGTGTLVIRCWHPERGRGIHWSLAEEAAVLCGTEGPIVTAEFCAGREATQIWNCFSAPSWSGLWPPCISEC